MKILFDHQIFTFQKFGGISRYFFELIRNLQEKELANCTLSALFSNNHYIQSSNFAIRSFFPNQVFRGKTKLQAFINKVYSVMKLREGNFDIFHPTYYDNYFLRHIGKKPFLLTVYDLIHERFSEQNEKEPEVALNKEVLAKQANAIVAISESTKRDLIEHLSIQPQKIKVVYLGNSVSQDFKKSKPENIPAQNYILFVGRRDGYKNFDRLIEAIAPLLSGDPTLSLVCAGGGSFSENEVAACRERNILNSVFQYEVDDTLLGKLYANAKLFVFPSLYEGFGIPILEAFAAGCPVACSNTSSLPEIAADGAFYFDPNDPQSILFAIKEVLNLKNKEDLVQKGRKRLSNFSWADTAQKTYEVYSSLL
ncbi:MAG: glycosyltransferase family 1 protein [Candidatus Riflebacteria bacterium]|nr:glycosyltransferase family 1 protein [Candidatus Riflebacteria bacterium]